MWIIPGRIAYDIYSLNKTLQSEKKLCYENMQSYTENTKEPF